MWEVRWVEHVAKIGKAKNSCRILLGKRLGNRPLGRPRRRCKDNTKVDLRV